MFKTLWQEKCSDMSSKNKKKCTNNKENIYKIDFLKIKNFYTSREKTKIVERQNKKRFL